MSEYLLQIAAKLEISSDDTVIWEMTDICSVLQESLTQLQKQENPEDKDTSSKHILHIIEYLKQYPPMLQKEKVTSYFHKNGIKYWFYIGNVDTTGKALKYEAVSLYCPGEDISGAICLDHAIKVPEGEFKVLGTAKFSSLKNTQHKLKKMTMPNAIKEMMQHIQEGKDLTSKAIFSVSKVKPRKQVTFAVKKKIQKKKKNGVSTFLKYLAPGAGSLLLNNQQQEHNETEMTTDEDNENDEDPTHHKVREDM